MADRDYIWLKATVGKFLNRTDLADIIPDLIAFGEDDIEGDFIDRRMEATIQIDGWVAGDVLPMPGDLKDIIALTINEEPVTFVASGGFDTLRSNQAGYFYTTDDNTILIHTHMDQNYPLILRYRRGVCHLSDRNKSDWLQCIRPSARLYAALVHSAPYLEDDARISTWRALYEAQIAGLENLQVREPVKLRTPYEFLGVRNTHIGGRRAGYLGDV